MQGGADSYLITFNTINGDINDSTESFEDIS